MATERCSYCGGRRDRPAYSKRCTGVHADRDSLGWRLAETAAVFLDGRNGFAVTRLDVDLRDAFMDDLAKAFHAVLDAARAKGAIVPAAEAYRSAVDACVAAEGDGPAFLNAWMVLKYVHEKYRGPS